MDGLRCWGWAAVAVAVAAAVAQVMEQDAVPCHAVAAVADQERTQVQIGSGEDRRLGGTDPDPMSLALRPRRHACLETLVSLAVQGRVSQRLRLQDQIASTDMQMTANPVTGRDGFAQGRHSHRWLREFPSRFLGGETAREQHPLHLPVPGPDLTPLDWQSYRLEGAGTCVRRHLHRLVAAHSLPWTRP